MNNPRERLGPYWWRIPIRADIGLLSPSDNQLGESPWARELGAVTGSPLVPHRPSVLPDGGLFSMLNRGRSQGPALVPAETNGGLFASLGRVVGDASRDPWTSMQDTAAWAPPTSSIPAVLPPNWPQAAIPFGDFTPLAQAPLQFESGSGPVPIARKRVDEAECKAMHDRDLFHCRMVGLPACYAQANLRYWNCLEGKQIPPLNY